MGYEDVTQILIKVSSNMNMLLKLSVYFPINP